jgi:hypothetical protein
MKLKTNLRESGESRENRGLINNEILENEGSFGLVIVLQWHARSLRTLVTSNQ